MCNGKEIDLNLQHLITHSTQSINDRGKHDFRINYTRLLEAIIFAFILVKHTSL